MNSRYYRTRIKYMDASRILPDPQPKRQLPVKQRVLQIFRHMWQRQIPAEHSSATFSERLQREELFRKPRATQKLQADTSKELNFDNPEHKPLKRLIQPKILKCPYSNEGRQRRAFSAGMKRSPLEYTFGRSDFQCL